MPSIRLSLTFTDLYTHSQSKHEDRPPVLPVLSRLRSTIAKLRRLLRKIRLIPSMPHSSYVLIFTIVYSISYVNLPLIGFVVDSAVMVWQLVQEISILSKINRPSQNL